MSEGTIYQRGPQGEVPVRQSINGVEGAYGTIGNEEHVTVSGYGWQRSWDNPGTIDDHSTYHNPRRIIQH